MRDLGTDETTTPRTRLRLGRGALPGALLFVAALAAPLPAPGQPAGQGAPAPTVLVTRVERQSITPGAEFIGRVEAIDKVDVRARITGFLTGRHFDEGQEVKAGDQLFTIEQEPFRAEVALREAELQRAELELRNAAVQVTRGRELVRTNNIPQSQLDERIASEGIAQGNVGAAKAQLDQARIQYGYTEIRAPFAGRVGRSPLSPGNVVSPDSGVLVTIVRDDPIRVTFPVTQRELLRFRREAGAGGLDQLSIGVRLPDGTMLPTRGKVEFINTTTERATDSVLVQALVPNPQRLLSDGQAVTAVVQLNQPREAIVVPQSALQIDQTGPFVLVVGEGNKVEIKRIKIDRGPSGQVVVTEGLEVGQLVIVEGSQRARPGAVVNPRPSAPPPTGAVPPSAARPG